MHLRRTPSTRPHTDALHITVTFSIEVRPEDVSSGFDVMDSQEAPAVDNGWLAHPASPLLLPDYETTQLLSRTIFTVSMLDQIAQDEMRNFGTLFFLPAEPPLGRHIFSVEETTRILRTETANVTSFSHAFGASNNLRDHADAIAVGEVEMLLTTTTWAQDILPLKNTDKPLFHFLCDSFYSHTPQHIFDRWFALRKYLSTTGQLLSGLIRQAEQLPRKKWPLIVLQLYFVLLDHKEALEETASIVELDDESIQCRLSAYCAALRIRLYLWRMTRACSMSRSRTYKRHVKDQCFRRHSKLIFNLISQEFSRMRDDHFQAVERRLDGDPVEITAITKPLCHPTTEFCTICQDMHIGSQCVMPLNCQCVFGRDCLNPLLNRDSPSSYTCPNCRTRLHEPLKWMPLPSNNERGRQIGLLWALRHNATWTDFLSQNEILADPEPFTLYEKCVGIFSRLMYGR
ncbi:uncharacterized protein K460DRAFT_403343 [Cucurbitaria berberidis CBS 394.84]|uniref:RING-type domain-containing protein n=1 Tax=Cucurbitaria berberidis CBS 394.84 TaxID=1168544 RepID=A0A9P4GLV3_9PLEO|nr:uncharacterized protein K460DRAFT_403343 [Cucurbitaria berberidis CBS 394.84]KAF1848042.1 hypothetical protein K460DRAFT_403343 [Cucurbitaria berberidis CBS 394.84]